MELKKYEARAGENDRQGWLTLLLSTDDVRAFEASHNEVLALKLAKKGTFSPLDVLWSKIGVDEDNRFDGPLDSHELAAEMLDTFHRNTPDSIREIAASWPPFADPEKLYLRRYRLGEAAGAMAVELRQRISELAEVDSEQQSQQWQEFLAQAH